MLSLIIKYNYKLHFEDVDPELPIKQIFTLIENKYNIIVENCYNIYQSSKLLDDNQLVKNYNISSNTILNVQFSMSKKMKNNPHDYTGEQAFSKLIALLEKRFKPNTFNVVSLMSYNVTEHIVQKNLIQQTQFNLLNQIIKIASNANEKKIRINMMLPDYNFIKYIKWYIQKYKLNYDIFKNSDQYDEFTQQIHDYLQISYDTKFMDKSELFYNRIIRFSIDSNNHPHLFASLNINYGNIKTKIYFYYIGITFKSNSEYDIPYGIINGFNYKKLFGKNLFVNMWTGDEIYSDIKSD